MTDSAASAQVYLTVWITYYFGSTFDLTDVTELNVGELRLMIHLLSVASLQKTWLNWIYFYKTCWFIQHVIL